MKAEILKVLRESSGHVSGQELCERFQVSRTAIWKVISQLKEEGYEIEAVRNKGYRLQESPDVLSKEEMESRIETRTIGKCVEYYAETDSTNIRAKQAAGQARREIMRLKRQKQNSDSDSEEIDAAIAHAQAMERVAKKKAKHLEEEEMMKAAGGICQGDRISEEETKDAESENARNAEEMSAESSADEMSRDLSAYEYAGNEVHAGDSYDISDYIDLGIDAFYAQTGDFMSEMSDFTSEMIQEMSDSLRDLMEAMGLDGLSDNAVSVNREMDPADLKMMKIKHRNKEMKDIVKADAEYLKAVFNHLEKMKDNMVIPTGTSFSADAVGVGVSAAPVPVINITL